VWKKFSEPRDGMTRDAAEDVFEPGERIDSCTLTGRHQAAQNRRSLAAFITTKEQPVVAAHGHSANGALDSIVVCVL
jgi:hypothetical protein